MRIFRNIFCLMLILSLCAGVNTVRAESASQMPKSGSSAGGSKFYNPNKTKFYNPSPLPKVEFTWPEFKFPEFKFPQFEFPKFFEEGAESETAAGGQLTAAAKPDSAVPGEDELLTHMEQMSGMVEKIKGILRDYAASQEDSGNKKISPGVKPLAVSGDAASAAGEGNLQALLGDLLAAQKDAPKIDPAKALEMAYAAKEKADQRRLEIEEEVRRMEEGY